MKKHFLIPALFLCAAAALLTVSCSKLMGYSVVLWTDPEKNLSDGDIVPVYIKSNISQTYVISAG
ncbi:MAG TPA: SH3 domain-containing protein, partial [Candidatus Treponema faecavium]|nr:SH3 domain-containing protein [Candidatus Treponema faecavium]